MIGMAATHVACSRCGHFTEIAAGETAGDTRCASCRMGGEEVSAVTAVAIIECPDGVSAEKAALGQVCADSDHDVSTGSHVVEVD